MFALRKKPCSLAIMTHKVRSVSQRVCIIFVLKQHVLYPVSNSCFSRLTTIALCLLKAISRYPKTRRRRDISGPEYRWALTMGQRPISHSFTYKNQDFDGPFCILMGLLEKMMGPRILYSHLTAKLTSNLNSLCMGPNQKLKQI